MRDPEAELAAGGGGGQKQVTGSGEEEPPARKPPFTAQQLSSLGSELPITGACKVRPEAHFLRLFTVSELKYT